MRDELAEVSEVFHYIARADCVCGTLLSDGGAVVERSSGWGTVRFVRCAGCGSWCQSPLIDPGSLSAWYDSDAYQGSATAAGAIYGNYIGDEAARVAEARHRYPRDLAPLLPAAGGRVLEIGCASGSLLSVVRDRGHDTVGIDMSRRFADAGRAFHGLDILVGDVLMTELAAASFDLVLMFGTISNVSNIPATLERIAELLRPGGTLAFNYPAADSFPARLYGDRCWMFAPSAATFLSRRGCAEMIARTGFRIVAHRLDRQVPSLHKLIKHSRLTTLLPAVERLAAGGWAMPWPVPIPGVRFVTAVRL